MPDTLAAAADGCLFAGGHIKRLPARYFRLAARRPACLLLAWTLLPILFISLILLSHGLPEIETELASSTYLRADGITSDKHEVLQQALEAEEQRRQRVSSRRLQQKTEVERRYAASWNLFLYYRASNIFDSEVIAEIRRIEKRIESLPSFTTFCLNSISRNDANNCARPLSAMNFFYGKTTPLVGYGPFSAYYIYPDGSNQSQQPIEAVKNAMDEDAFWTQFPEKLRDRSWYFDAKFPDSQAMKSKYVFGVPLPGFKNRLDRPDEQRALYNSFVQDELYPLLTEEAAKGEVTLNYEGEMLTSHEIKLVLFADASKAIASLVLVYLYMAAYTRAPLVALLGMSTVALSIPLGTALFVALGHQTLPAINFLVLFLLTGIGADHLFVLMDSWRQTKRDHSDHVSRLKLTFRRAGKSIAACGTTTAISFLSNLFSAVRPLRWFGLFVGLCVLANLVLVLGMFPPVLLLREQTKKDRVKEITVDAVQSSTLAVQSSSSPASDPATPTVTRNLSASSTTFMLEVRSPVRGGVEFFPTESQPEEKEEADAPSLKGKTTTNTGAEDDHGREVPYSFAERFFGDRYAPWLYRWRWACLLLGFAATVACLLLVGFRLKASRSGPAFITPGAHNLADVATRKAEFSASKVWSVEMERKPLMLCEGCDWDQDCLWSSWGEWEACSASCDGGLRYRSREVAREAGPAGEACLGGSMESEECGSRGCNSDCVWGPWTTWGDCIADCGGGMQNRSRQVLEMAWGNGSACAGDGIEYQGCLNEDVPQCFDDCKITPWVAAGNCSATCGGGTQLLQRRIEEGVDVASCAGVLLEQNVSCGLMKCTDPCTYEPWEDDTDSGCSVTCGSGLQTRIRRAHFPAGGDESACFIPADSPQRRMAVPCHVIDCPENIASACSEDLLGMWTDWSACTKGIGCEHAATRQRLRSVPAVCEAAGINSSDKEVCSMSQPSSECLPECQVLDWQEAGDCSASCGWGKRREVVNTSVVPAPLQCSTERMVDCHSKPCPVDCALGEWRVASPCSVPCEGAGKWTLVRPVLRRSYHGGEPCPPELSPQRRVEARCDFSDVLCTVQSRSPVRAPVQEDADPDDDKELPDSQVATVDVVFGLRQQPLRKEAQRDISGAADLLDSKFDFGTLEGQSAVKRLCEEVVRQKKRLNVRKAECFVEDLDMFLQPVGFPYAPADHIHSRVVEFLSVRKFEKMYRNDIGFMVDETGQERVRWLSVRFVTNIPWKTQPGEALEWLQVWEEFIAERNNQESGFDGVGTMFQTSSLWVRAEFETRLVGSAFLSSCSSILFALLAVFLFLGNAAVAVYIILVNVCTIVCLAGFMVGILNWEFGAVEAVALIIIVGLSVDYSLHLAESYLQSDMETRYKRVQDALRRTGSALVGAAATSVLSCPPILLCTIQVFVRFGCVIIISMVLSLLFSLFFFTSLLFLLGPVDNFGSISAICELLLWLCGRAPQRKQPPVVIQSTVGTVVSPVKPASEKDEEAYTWSTYDDCGVETQKRLEHQGTFGWVQPALSAPGTLPTSVTVMTRPRHNSSLPPQNLGRNIDV